MRSWRVRVSTFTTSAPKSARSRVQNGPARIWLKSKTRISERGGADFIRIEPVAACFVPVLNLVEPFGVLVEDRFFVLPAEFLVLVDLFDLVLAHRQIDLMRKIARVHERIIAGAFDRVADR